MTAHAAALAFLWVMTVVGVGVIIWVVRDLVRDPGRPRRDRRDR